MLFTPQEINNFENAFDWLEYIFVDSTRVVEGCLNAHVFCCEYKQSNSTYIDMHIIYDVLIILYIS